MKKTTSLFMHKIKARMRSDIECDTPFDSDTLLYNAILGNRYIVEVTQFDVTELYSTSNYRQALEFIDNYDREDKDIIIRTYDLSTYSYEDNRFEPIF